MKTNASAKDRGLRVLILLPIVLTSTAALLQADVARIAGTVTSSVANSRYSNMSSNGFQVQGPNFSLTGTAQTGALLNFGPAPSGGTATVRFNPGTLSNDVAPLVFAGGANSIQFVYNGVTYSNVQVSLNFAGTPVTVPNMAPSGSLGGYAASVSNVPFTMTGQVAVYASAPPFSGPALFTVPFSGSGNYAASGTGENALSGSPSQLGNATYQFYPTPVAFQVDSATQGAWNGKYGGEGYYIANGPSAQPPYAAVSTSRAYTYTWAAQTTEPRALQNAVNSNTRIASAYTANSFDINLYFTDNNAHPVALYLLDWDTGGRTETITITNANTGAVIDTETISNFHNGVYAIWNLQGAVTINVKGGSAVVSGIFFGPSGTTTVPFPQPVTFYLYYLQDNTTQGNWPNKISVPPSFVKPNMIANNSTSAPPNNATLNIYGALTYTWSAQTSDVRAPLTSQNASTRIASAYTQYPGGSFTINVNALQISGVSIYMLDWDNEGRTQTVTLTDAATGALIDSRTFSNFQNGVYGTWVFSGRVVFKVTGAGASNPVVSGIFIN